MKYALVLGCITTILLCAGSATAKPRIEIERVSHSITVKVENNLLNGNLEEGSGFIAHRQGDIYTVVTNRHVVCPEEKPLCPAPTASEYIVIITPDGEKNSVNLSNVKMLGQGLDLAIIQFRSVKKYPVAQVNTSSTLKADDTVYVGGFPINQTKLRFSVGQSLVVVRKRLSGDNGGYTIGYDALTLGGMSGGAVFDRDGKVVAIHGQGDRFPTLGNLPSVDTGAEGIKAGTNRGIPVEYLVRELKAIKIDIGGTNLPFVSVPETSVTRAEEYLLLGYNKWIESNSKTDKLTAINEKRQAIKFYNQSIELNPRQAKSYALRGFIYLQIKEFDKVISNYNSAIINDPNYAAAYYLRGNFKIANLKDFPGAINDYNRAISLRPEYSGAYLNRGDAKFRLNDLQGAISDLNRAIELEPSTPENYILRIIVKLKLQDNNGAKSDLEEMFENGSSTDVGKGKSYFYSGILKMKYFQDRAGALHDFQKAKDILSNIPKTKNGSLIAAINIQLEEFEPWAITIISGIKKQEAGNIQGALADYSRAIELNPKNAQAYLSRALLKALALKDFQGALADYSRAIELNPENTQAYLGRASLKFVEFKDTQGAKLDLDQVIKLEPENMQAYLNRGMFKRILQDRAGAIEDIRKAVRFYKRTDRMEENKRVEETINSQLKDLGINDIKLSVD